SLSDRGEDRGVLPKHPHRERMLVATSADIAGAEKMEAVRDRLLASYSPEKIDKSNVQQTSISVAVLTDKSRMLRGISENRDTTIRIELIGGATSLKQLADRSMGIIDVIPTEVKELPEGDVSNDSDTTPG